MSQVSRFHSIHGSNLILKNDRTVAYREKSFAHALAFSEKPLLPGEIFMIEIEELHLGWNGHLRIGITFFNPDKVDEPLPKHSIPDLMSMQVSWIFALTNTPVPPNNCFEIGVENSSCPSVPYHLGDTASIYTCRGKIPRKNLRPPLISKNYDVILPTDVGSRIGVVYVPKKLCEGKADLHFIINGEEQGPCVSDIPINNQPLYAIVDVYGITKKVRIVQLHIVPTLQSICRDKIRQNVKIEQLLKLPIPKSVIEYLQFYSL